MKKIYLFLFSLLPFIANAQKKVDLDKYRFTVQFMALPAMRLDSTYRTYNVEVEYSKLMQHFGKDLVPENSVRIEGWKKLPQDGHLSIKVKLDDLLPESVTTKERSEVIKNRAGQITGTRNYYHQEVVYSFAAIASITDYKGMHIMDEVLANRQNKQVFRSPEFALRSLAEGYFLLNSIKVTNDLYRNSITRAMHYLSDRITDNFGFNEVTVNDYMWIVDSKKHPEYDDHRQAFKKLTEVLFSMNAKTPIDGAREQLKPVIDYFESIKSNYSSNNRHDRKLRYASYFNLAVLYYYLDDPQMMMKEAKGLILNDFDAKDGKAFEQTALSLKNIFNNTKINTRHFNIDPSTFKGPLENNNTSTSAISTNDY